MRGEGGRAAEGGGGGVKKGTATIEFFDGGAVHTHTARGCHRAAGAAAVVHVLEHRAAQVVERAGDREVGAEFGGVVESIGRSGGDLVAGEQGDGAGERDRAAEVPLAVGGQ